MNVHFFNVFLLLFSIFFLFVFYTHFHVHKQFISGT